MKPAARRHPTGRPARRPGTGWRWLPRRPWRNLAWCSQAPVAAGIVFGLGSAVVLPPANGSWSLHTAGGWALEALMVALFVVACLLVAPWQRRAVQITGRPRIVGPYPLGLGRAAPLGRRAAHRILGALRWAGPLRDVIFALAFVPLGAVCLAVAWCAPMWVAVWVMAVGDMVGIPGWGLSPDWPWIVPLGPLVLAALPWTWQACAWAGDRLARAVTDPTGDLARRRRAELEASRRRLSGAFQSERRRIERDLHDGAQQRIVAQAMTLGAAEAELTDLGPPGAAALDLVRSARAENRAILAELRDLVRAIHPQVLVDHGLAAALEEVAARSPVPVTCTVRAETRAPELIESTAYFVALEAMTNAARHASARAVQVRARLEAGVLYVSVCDDGVGGADLVPGGGLAGLADRVEAVGGTFDVSSPPGGPTVVRADLPCDAMPLEET